MLYDCISIRLRKDALQFANERVSVAESYVITGNEHHGIMARDQQHVQDGEGGSMHYDSDIFAFTNLQLVTICKY